MASFCGRFHFTPEVYWALTVEEADALWSLMLAEAEAAERR
jgi:hypothetical protein